MFCGFGEEERTRFTKKRRTKKEKKKLIEAKSGLVGMKRYFETYNRVKYFLWHLNRF